MANVKLVSDIGRYLVVWMPQRKFCGYQYTGHHMRHLDLNDSSSFATSTPSTYNQVILLVFG